MTDKKMKSCRWENCGLPPWWPLLFQEFKACFKIIFFTQWSQSSFVCVMLPIPPWHGVFQSSTAATRWGCLGFNKSENFSTKRVLCTEGFKLSCLVDNREMDVESSSSSFVDDAAVSLSGMFCISWAHSRYIGLICWCIYANSFCLQKRI